MRDIFKKEMYRVFGDKKMILSLFVLPLVLMVGLYGLMGVLVKNMVSDIEEHISVVYIQNAPEEVKQIISASGYLDTAEVTYLEADTSVAEMEEIRTSILNGDAQLLVTFETGFMEKVTAYENAGDAVPLVTIGYNSSENYSNAAQSNFTSMVLATLETALLQSRFHDLNLLTVFQLEQDEIINEEKAGGEFLAMMLPYLIVFMLFSSAMGICVDAIAGEKERGTMASMLLTPVKRTSIVFGKLFALSLLSILSSLVYAGSTIFGMPLMMGGMEEEVEGLSMNLSLSPLQAVELLLLMGSLVLVYVAAICLLSVFAKNTKEASSYVMPLYMVVLVLGIMTMFSGSGAPAQGIFAIPVYGTAVAIQNIVMSEITVAQFGMNVASNLVCTLLLVVVIAKVFNNEKIMLNA